MMTIAVYGYLITVKMGVWMKKAGVQGWLIVGFGLLLNACMPTQASKLSDPDSTSSVTLYAAASVSDVMDELVKNYETTHRTKVHVSYAGSATLAKQIKEGAKADVFVSADSDWMTYLQKYNKATDAKPLLTNSLVIIAPRAAPLSIDMSAMPNQALHEQFDGKLCTGQTDSVPAGKYAKQALMTKNWWQGMQGRLVETADVRSALNFVARGECALGIVYATDAKTTNQVVVVGVFEQGMYKPIVYPITNLNTSPAAKAFYNYLQSDTAKRVYQKYGFGVVQ